jgi:multisubunit Na+/H+ antiporter MnhC subunit
VFVGHYSVAFAVKTESNKIPLWVLFVAVQFLDYIWATLVLLGIEKLRIVKGFTAGSMNDSYFHPYSHSLVTAVLWSSAAALCYNPLCRSLGYRYTKSTALVIGVAVFSHWILDLIAHPRDLPLYDNTAKVGFGLWNYRGPEFALEIALLVVGIVLYLTRNIIPAVRKAAVVSFGIALTVVQIGDTYVPRAALTDKQTALGVWIFYSLFVLIAFVLEKIRSRPATA